MSQTKKGQKFIRVEEYKKADGTVVKAHVRSTPDPYKDGKHQGKNKSKGK